MNGRIFTGIAVFVGLAAFIQVSFGQLSPQEKYGREIIVEFRPGTIQMPAGEISVPPNKLDTLKPLVAEVIERHEAELVLVAFPGYDPADTIAISPTGELVKKPDLSRIYKIRFPEGTDLDKVIEELSALPDVVYDERIPRYEYYVTPNDEYFNLQWGLDQASDCDIDAPEAWDITKGSSLIKLGIVDAGIDENHVDLSGKVSGDAGYSYEHGTHVAGIAAAKTNNNNEGIAGVNWHAQLHDEDISWDQNPIYIDPDKVYPAVISAVDAGCHVLNNSWGGPDYSVTHRRAFAYAYKMNRVAVVSMGNEGSSDPRYPAAYGEGIIAVGATENDDARWSLSNTGNHIDVVAPGGNGYPWNPEDIYSTLPNDDYNYRSGTSMAAPFVTGLAGLLKGYNTDLYNDDIEQIIRISADTVPCMNGQEWTPEYGDGRINAHTALQLLGSPNQLKQWNASGGSIVAHGSSYETRAFFDVPGLAPGVYLTKWYRVQKGATFSNPFVSTPYAWGRGVGTNGFSIANPNYGMGWCRVVPGTVTSTSATLETYVYDVYNLAMDHIGWFPCEPSEVQFKYTALGKPASVHLSGWMECLNPPKSGDEPKDVYHFRAHLSWTYNGPLNHYELWRKLKNPRPQDPTDWVEVYDGNNTSFIDPYDFQAGQGAWYYVKAYFTGSSYIQSNTIYLEADAPPSPPQGLSGVWEHIGKDWAEITLQWEPNPEPDLSGYYVYRRTSSSGPFNKVGTVEPLETPVFVDRVYAWRSYWYYVTAFDTLENESGPSDIIRVDPEYYPACPFLYVWDGMQFIEDNNLLAGSYQGEVVTDLYRLTQPLIESDPPRRYKLEIREEETEHSFFDRVTLKTADHPEDVEVGVNTEGEIIPVTTVHTPVSAVSGGEDYANVLSNDTTWFEGCAGDTMVVEFGAIEETDDKELWLNSDKSGYPIGIEIEREAGWEYVTSVFPRENFSTIPVVSLSEIIDDGEALTLRLVWFAEHNLKTVRIVQLEDVFIVERTAPLIFAVHSRLGNVWRKLLYEDEDYAEVLPGDTLRIVFTFRRKIPGWTRDFVLVSNGYYTTEIGGGGAQTTNGNIPIAHFLSLYPNPARNDMTIKFGIPKEERVSLKVYDVSGREVNTLVDGRLEAGYHTIRLDGKNLPSGVYFARLVTDNYKTTKKLVLMK